MVVASDRSIVGLELQTEPAGFHPDYRIEAGIECRPTIEHMNTHLGFLQLLPFAEERVIRGEAQKAA